MNILLVPGFMLDGDMWTELRPTLSEFGQLVDVDTTQDATIEAMAARAVEALEGPAVVIGFSMGGYVARSIVYQAPHNVRGLALIVTSSRADPPKLTPERAEAARSSFGRIGRAAVRSSLHPDHRTDAMIARVQGMSERLGGDVLARQAQIARTDDSDRLGEITCPTLVVAAAQDELRTLRESEILHEGVKGSSLEIIEESGHLIPLEQPARLAELLRSLCEKAVAAQ